MTKPEQTNEKYARRFNEEVRGQRNGDAIDQLVADDVVGDNAARPEPVRGSDGVRELADLLYAACPDCGVRLKQIVADGDRIAQRVSVTATHEGEFMGIDPTGNPVALTGMDLTRFVDGKWVEGYDLRDMLGLFTQRGVIEPPRE
ncbi:ester cyclase [Halopenitus persicus]|uniref:ester cyclase n=1 Tax=Halopenitus persicus TaxID=1048396 RepID=UPI000BBA5271|nr:ester cyclase [Halopenitus persicus]